MKLKLDDNGNVVVKDGLAVYVDSAGKEIAFDPVKSLTKISELNAESKERREALEVANSKLEKFGDIDPDLAIKSIEIAKGLKDGDLADAKKIQEIHDSYAVQLTEMSNKMKAQESAYNQATLKNKFATCSINDKLAIPADMFFNSFSGQFSFDENGVLVAKDSNGNPILSKTNYGQPADFEEAIQTILDSYPHKDQILKGSGSSGSGTGGNHGGNGARKWDDYTEAERATLARDNPALFNQLKNTR